MTDRDVTLEAALSKLDEDERLKVLAIINKDKILRAHHELQIMRLKSELEAARRKCGSGGGGASGRSCARCRAELGRIINRGAFCRWCRHRVCKNCREYITNDTSNWVCTVCHKQMELTATSGDWMNQFVRRPSKRRENRIAAVETVKRSLQRSWTFSDASPSPWAALRNSPEMRAYSSMPRHQDCEFIARTAFTNRLNLTKTSDTETSEQHTTYDTNSIKIEIDERSNDDTTSIPETDSTLTTVDDKALDSEPSEDNTLSAIVTDNESSIGSPMVDKRSLSESTSMDQSSIGSPVVDNRFCHDSPLGSSGESPLIEKRIYDMVGEPITGNVFRKVTLKKRRVNTRNLPPGVTPPRSRRNVLQRSHDDVDLSNPFLEQGKYMRDREDYKLVFISSSDSSSREELQSDDGSSTSSGLVAGSECDWDYFEPGSGNGSGGESGSASVVPHQSASASGSASVRECVSVPVPIPVPFPVAVPVPVLVPIPWTPDLTIRIQHLWSMQQLVTVTLNDGQMSQRLSEDLRQAALKHFADIAARQPVTDGGSLVKSPAVQPPTENAEDTSDKENVNSDNVVLVETLDAVPKFEGDSDKIDVVVIESKSGLVSINKESFGTSDLISSSKNNINLNNIAKNNRNEADNIGEITDSNNSDTAEVDGVVLKKYKILEDKEESNFPIEPLQQKECSQGFMEAKEDDSESSSSSSDESGRVNKLAKRFYKFDRQEESEESSDDEDSSGEFSMASSLSSSPGSGKFKRVFVVNDSDSDLGELPEYNDDSAQEEGEVTLLRHVNMDEVRLSSILVDGKKKEDMIDLKRVIGDRQDTVAVGSENEPIPVETASIDESSSLMLQDSLECGVIVEQELPESEHEVLSPPLSADKTFDKISSIEDSLDLVQNSAYSHELSAKGKSETSQFLSKEIEYCDKMSRVGSDFILTKVVEGSDEECSKVCETETRGSNTSDEFSGTESMELEQGQIRPTGPVTAAGESWRETGRYTSLVMITQEHLDEVNVVTSDTTTLVPEREEERYTLTLDTTAVTFPQDVTDSEVHVVTGNGTTAVVILEEGLPDDDSWVEDLDRDDLVTTTEDSSEDDTSYVDREEELRGYNPRSAIDFTLHTIVEESCEESEVEMERNRPTELEKYFFYGVGDGLVDNREMDTMSETSSIHSEGLESLGGYEGCDHDGKDPAEMASSRLEKYFLSGLLGCSRRDSDGSVGSDSEGKPSPEQRRKRLVRARGTGRLHSNSQDNLNESEQQEEVQIESEGSSTETDSYNDLSTSFEKNDGQFDTVKRTKKKKRSVVTAPSLELLETADDQHGSGSRDELDSDDGSKTPQPDFLLPSDLGSSRNKQQSRDSGFMGSCDDLLKENKDSVTNEVSGVPEEEVEKVPEVNKVEEPVIPQVKISPPIGLIRKDSFNNWSSDEETNLMMSKMRQFFKTMVASQPKPSSPIVGARNKPPQLVHFESELTRLMKTVPGIRDEQVKEIVEYLSSEDTWSDSYDSSDYTSSDLEGGSKKSALQAEISASCRQIISNFEAVEDPASTSADGINKDTAFVYQRLVASFSKLENPSSDSSTSHNNSPPLIAKVMQHIGSRLVALMHEVSSAEGGSPKTSRYHRRLQPKMSTTSTTEDEEDSIEDYSPLPRSKSHDPLIEENRQEASDNERFSWRGSFESALMASDSRQRLASGGEGSVSASALALAAKRRSAGDLLFKTSSREQLDRVRSCGSIGGSVEDKIWGMRHQKRRRSSVPDSGGSNDGDDDSEEDSGRSTTLPRSLQSSCAATNSLPRLPTTPTSASPSIYKAHSVHQVSSSKSVVSARYRPPGYSSRNSAVAPPRRDAARRRAAQTPSPSNISSPPSVVSDDASVCSEPVSVRSPEEDDRLTNNRASSSSLGMSSTSLGARSDSLASVYSGAGEGRYGSVAVRGEVEFGLQYNYKQGALEIYVKQCRDLAAVDTKRNRSDPYVKVYLLPDKSKSGKRKTRVKKHTLNPVFEETLKFHITLDGLESRTLWLSVWHSDMFGRNDFLGEVTMALENKVFDDPLPKLYTLQERTEPLEELLSSRGELIVGLKYVPPETSIKKNKGCLQVLVKEAKNLAAVKSNGTSDPFCKSYLLPDKGRSSKQKTPVVRKCCSPAWHHTFTYQGVTLEELSSRSLELTIWDHDRLASNEFLGGVRLNLGTGKHNSKAVDWMDACGKETSLWQRMLERPNLWVESCLPLRPSLDVRNTS